MRMEHDALVATVNNIAWDTPLMFLENPAQRKDNEGFTEHLGEKHCAWTIGELFARQIREDKMDVSTFASESDIAESITNVVAYYCEDIVNWVEKKPIEFSCPEQYRRLVVEADIGPSENGAELGYGVSADGSVWYSSGLRFVFKRDNDPANELGFYIEDAYPLRKFANLEKSGQVGLEKIMDFELEKEDKLKLAMEVCKNESDAVKIYPNMSVKKLVDIESGHPMTFISVRINDEQRITLDCKPNRSEIKLFTYSENGKQIKNIITMDKLMSMSPELYDLFVKIDACRHEIYNDHSKEYWINKESDGKIGNIDDGRCI